MTDTAARVDYGPETVVAQAFGIVHKRALGLALGTAAAGVLFLLTWFHVLIDPETGPDLSLLNQYFYGYTVTAVGSCIGAFWAFVAGFVAGWFLAFTRNFALALQLALGAARTDAAATSDILDHI